MSCPIEMYFVFSSSILSFPSLYNFHILTRILDDMARNAVKPLAESARYCCRGERGQEARRHHCGGGQHFPDVLPAEAARLRRRHSYVLTDKVHEWTL